MKKDVEIVREHLDLTERLTQLAEEAAELAQAALKMRRALTNINPTPISIVDAIDNVMDELADVAVCVDALNLNGPIERRRLEGIAEIKMSRWATRLTENGGGKA